jgi:tetratricopeptide (TPR) repeat protein
LEMAFEHRNYLPTMFVFVPLAALLQKGIDAGREGQYFRRRLLAAATVAAIVALGTATYSRNSLWNDKRLFWEDALVKAPNTARPYLQLAAYHEARRNFSLALKLYRHSLNVYDPAPKRARALALTHMGVLFRKTNQNELARGHFRRALEVFPEHEIARYNLVSSLLAAGDYQEAREHADILLRLNPMHPYYLNAAGLTRLGMGDPAAARSFLEQALARKPNDLNTATNLGVALSRLGRQDAAAQVLERAARLAPQNPLPRLCLIDLSLAADKPAAAGRYTRELLAGAPLGVIDGLLEPPGNNRPLFDRDAVGAHIAAYISGLEIDAFAGHRVPADGSL